MTCLAASCSPISLVAFATPGLLQGGVRPVGKGLSRGFKVSGIDIITVGTIPAAILFKRALRTALAEYGPGIPFPPARSASGKPGFPAGDDGSPREPSGDTTVPRNDAGPDVEWGIAEKSARPAARHPSRTSDANR